jgi:hypothetical protein
MNIEYEAALASTMLLTDLVGKLDQGTATENEVKLHRFLVNANKYVTSIAATDVVHRAIEILGGNGTIEDFSPLPRLYRDSIVFESWEGTHNVLCAQVHRDCARLDLLDVVFQWIETELSTTSTPQTINAELIRRVLLDLEPRIRKSAESSSSTPSVFRQQLGLLTRIIQAVSLLKQSTTDLTSNFIHVHVVSARTDADPPIGPFH